MKWRTISIVAAVFVAALAAPACSASRVALVIGNGAYYSAPLKNPVNDATDMAALLTKLDFEVIRAIDANKRDMLAAVNRFSSALKKSEIGLFYFSGHGMQVNNRNYLIPVGENVLEENDVEFEAVDAGRIIGKMRAADNRLNIVILDACRNNPFQRSFRTAAQGLARMDAPKGTIIAYATSPGSVAADGRGRNGVFTKYLLSAMQKPNLDIQDIFNEAGMGVMAETGDLQIPWTSNTPIPRYYLAGGNPDSASDAGNGHEPVPQTGALEVKGQPSGADITINDKTAGRSPLKLGGLKPGLYKVSASKAGYLDQVFQVEIEPGGGALVRFDLQKKITTGTLRINTTPATALVKILNTKQKYTHDIRLEEGRYQIEVSAPGFITDTRWVDLAADSEKIVAVNLVRLPFAPPSGPSYIDPKTGMELVRVKGGCFQMGCAVKVQTSSLQPQEVLASLPLWQWPLAVVAALLPVGCAKPPPPSFYEQTGCDEDELPRHEVCVDDFYIGRYEVTQGEYLEIMGTNPSRFRKGDRYPVEMVSWDDAREFIEKLNNATANKYRLPTEAEWEYGARSGGKQERYAGSNAPDSVAWYSSNSGNSSHQVGTKGPNSLGLYDMSGNVWEWTGDYYSAGYYKTSPRSNPSGPSSGAARVYRGGCWGSGPGVVRAADRGGDGPGLRSSLLGFRLVLPVQP